eukprot:12348150-Alexandrium_andersonii.AAC.1
MPTLADPSMAPTTGRCVVKRLARATASDKPIEGRGGQREGVAKATVIGRRRHAREAPGLSGRYTDH